VAVLDNVERAMELRPTQSGEYGTAEIIWRKGGQSVRQPDGSWLVRWENGDLVRAEEEHVKICIQALSEWKCRAGVIKF